MLFARFLAESDLLMHPDGYPVSLNDCKEDAESFDPPARSEWEVAGHYASAMLPNVFRPDSPALALQLPLETEQALEALLAKLPATVFQADDSLGWSYQFWQAPKKEEVQRQMKQAGTKVGADELPAVTQLFTEQYMVAFLLENALGGWWHSRHPRMKLPVEMPYLRFTPSPLAGDGRGEGGSAVPPAPTSAKSPAAGTFPAWPDTLAQFKLLDPCLGSGHFLVSALHYLVPMRQATEKLSVRDAIDSVLADNLHGLELDARCVEIAAFALALAAWRYPDEKGEAIGYRPLPRLNIACVGVAPRSKKTDWLKLAGGDERLEGGMAALFALFQKAPELGSLIDPMAATRGDLLDAHWEELESRLEQALAQKGNDQEIEARVAAQGMVQASRILTRKYHLVITNPPYLGTRDHGPVLKDFCEEHYKTAKSDLANVFLERSLKLCTLGGTKDRKSNGLSGSMADAGCSRQSPIAVRHVSRLTERRPKWDRKHCLMHGEWPPAATLHASGTSCPPAPTRRCADRTRSPVRAGLTNPTEDRCQPVPPLLPPPTAVARAPGRCAVAGWIRRCGRGPCPRQ
jgi:hypothetical protein